MMKKILIFCLLLITMAACVSEPTPTESPILDATALYLTAIYQVTLDAALVDDAVSTQTLPSLVTSTSIPTIDRTRPPVHSPTPADSCNQAAAGNPFDVTVPDGTVMTPGESFSKTWRLKNVGSCTWTRLYAVTFYSSNSMNATQTNYLLQEVKPGDVIDVTVNMEAPQSPGVYQSNWMLSNADGELFGIGPNGDAPFWAHIEVVPAVTTTPQPTPTVTSTPVVYLTGERTLRDGNQLDLDSDTLNPENLTKSDFIYRTGEDPAHILMTMNGTIWKMIGDQRPTFGDCQQETLSGLAVSFNEVPEGSYLCYRTSDGLPGRLLIEGLEGGLLSLSYLTWSLP